MTFRSFILVTFLLLFQAILVKCHVVESFRHARQHVRGLHSEEDNGDDHDEVYPRNYKLWTPEEIHHTIDEWQERYPDLVRTTTSQKAFGLPKAGGPDDCPYDEGDGCDNHIITIQDFVVHPENSPSSNSLPEVLWSGCVHGDERVGPTAVMEAAALLLEAATCEAKPSIAVDRQDKNQELQNAIKCRTALEKKGIKTPQRQWLARLVATRRIVIVPTANALGYYRNHRTEEKIDPNRDFPFDLKDPTKCMQTIAGRTLNEVFREHMIQLSLTFHGGMEVVAYEWGAPTYLGYLSPDNTAQSQIASAYSQFGGGWATDHPYDNGTMNDLVYYVEGGMEDWAYAGSWDTDRVVQCQPTTFGGYPAEKTVYNNSTLRVFNMLVETSDTKEPKTNLGSSLDVVDKGTPGNGHVSRNIRVALLAADLVEPYVSIVGVDDLFISDDIAPMTPRDDHTTCQRTKGVMIPQNAGKVSVHWSVGGAFTIDETELLYGKWSDLADDDVSCMTQPNDPEVLEKKLTVLANKGKKGTGYFSQNGPSPHDKGSLTRGPVFSTTLDVSGFKPRDQIVVLVRARVDQSWTDQKGKIEPKIPPQSHVVNARTNPDWHHESAGKVIQGRLDWYTTIPLTIVIGDYNDSIGRQSGRQVGIIELSNRFGHTTGGTKGGISPHGATSGSNSFGWQHLLGIFFALALCGVICAVFVQYRSEARHHRLVNEIIEEEEGDFAGSKPYTDYVEDDELEGDFEPEDDDAAEDVEDPLGPENGHEGDVELPQYTID